ncbi:MOSC domain-containing protein [Alteromonas sp. C1M14]|uniref:MOSC domain-containing protein n=1 Tax=Alteromonas sp. C1M14 TaxID=2841567 RepID=UPI001C088B80|nr:MOSC domain-containing protein [Alteromonas sp. C1M14]MBU2980121.1 MOSC domain-containing protein [Alteromonas sp. C1M14]
MFVEALFAGKPVAFGPRGAPSAIQKASVALLTVGFDGTKEDEQGNKKLHGGAEKVLHQFSHQGYTRLREGFDEHDFPLGSIGENMLVPGMNDENVFIGDVYRVGEVTLQVSAPRAPCNKISHRYGIKNLDRFVGANGITGWYYRVIETGVIHGNDPVTLLSRHDKTVSVAALMRAVHDLGDIDGAKQFEGLETLDDEWREKCTRVIKRAASKTSS